jgi:hypothetical protein
MKALILVALIAVVSPSPTPCVHIFSCSQSAQTTKLCAYTKGALTTRFVAGACLPSPPPTPEPAVCHGACTITPYCSDLPARHPCYTPPTPQPKGSSR